MRAELIARVESATHTPGPWRALCLKKYTRVTRDRQGPNDKTGSVEICHIAGPEEDDIRPWNGARWEADARLMAAAPDLLEALQYVLSAHGEQLTDAFDQARRAIARALPQPQDPPR